MTTQEIPRTIDISVCEKERKKRKRIYTVEDTKRLWRFDGGFGETNRVDGGVGFAAGASSS